MMKTVKLSITYLLLVVMVLLTSCRRRAIFPFITSIPCEDINVVIDPNIINDFNCQTNKTLPDVEAVLNPEIRLIQVGSLENISIQQELGML